MSQGIKAIQTEATTLVQGPIYRAILSEDWVGLHRLAEQLKDLADRGMYHAQMAKVQEINKLALNGHNEGECR